MSVQTAMIRTRLIEFLKTKPTMEQIKNVQDSITLRPQLVYWNISVMQSTVAIGYSYKGIIGTVFYSLETHYISMGKSHEQV